MAEDKKTQINIKIKPSIIIAVAAVIAVLAVGGFVFGGTKSTLNVSTSIDKVIKINKISTVEYPYEGIAKVKIDKEGYHLVDDSEEANLYVKYKGRVVLGIDFDKVAYNVDESNKKITFTMPAVENQGPKGNEFNIDLELKTIKKNWWDSVSEEKSRAAANEDLERRVFENQDGNDLIQLTKDNIEDIITGLMTSIDDNYSIEFVWGK